MTTSAHIASFVADIREHLQEEADAASSLVQEGKSFSAGFAEGFSFWQKIYQAEDDFRYALRVLGNLLGPLQIKAPAYRELTFSSQAQEEVVELLLREISSRDQELQEIQQRLLSVSPEEEKELYSPEVRKEFEDSFHEGLRNLLG